MTVSGSEGSEGYTTTYAYDANNRLTSETKDNVTTTYTYDNNGNTIGKATGTTLDVYSYNLYNQLTGNIIGGVNASYTYNAKGIRTSKTVGTDVTSFILDGGNVIAEVKGTEVVDYIRGINLICTDESYYLYNAHGDVVSLTSTSGVVTKTYDYDAFGNEADPSDADTNPFRYCGEYYDTETGTYYLRARYYDPAVGRFGTEDPAHDGLNWYTYCSNNPISFIDPTGLWEEGDEKLPKWAQDAIREYTDGYYSSTTAAEKEYYHQKAVEVRKSVIRNGNSETSLVDSVIDFFDPNTNKIEGSFSDGLIKGSGSVTGGYSEFKWRLNDQIKSSGKNEGWIGGFGKISLGNAHGKVGIGDDDLSVSLKGVADVLVANAQAGLYFNDGVGIGAGAKASVINGRSSLEFDILDWQIELGVTGHALSVGGEVLAGYFPDEGFCVKANASALFGWGILIRVMPPQ